MNGGMTGSDELPDVELSEAALLAAARQSTGLDDFGDEADWKEGFTRLLASLNEAGIRFRDLSTTQSSLEEIFVGLVHQDRNGGAK